MMDETHKCPDCGVAPGEFHVPGCDVERCPFCGGQLIGCGCCDTHLGLAYMEDPTPEQSEKWEKILRAEGREPWSGEWPGVADCRENGWYSRWDERRAKFVRCDPYTPTGQPDLNRCNAMDAVWDRTARRWRKPSEATSP